MFSASEVEDAYYVIKANLDENNVVAAAAVLIVNAIQLCALKAAAEQVQDDTGLWRPGQEKLGEKPPGGIES